MEEITFSKPCRKETPSFVRSPTNDASFPKSRSKSSCSFTLRRLTVHWKKITFCGKNLGFFSLEQLADAMISRGYESYLIAIKYRDWTVKATYVIAAALSVCIELIISITAAFAFPVAFVDDSVYLVHIK